MRNPGTTIPAAPASERPRTIFSVGELVGGIYEITALLGEGGMGQVFEAIDRVLDRRVAIKAAWSAPRGSSLINEARALAAFRHPSLVTVHTVGEHLGVEYIVMERIYGTSLAGLLEHRAAASLPITLAEGLGFLLAITEGLAVVHRAGLAHRDVKPDNVMLTPDHRVVLTDFGLVVAERIVAEQTIVVGSPPYMAPEAITGTTAAGAGHLLDLYGLGVTAFELFSGVRPIGADSIEELLRIHREEPPPRLSSYREGLPDHLVDLIAELMAKDPLDRPPSAEAVAWQLRAIRERSRAQPDRAAPTDQLDVLVVEDDRDVARILEFHVRRALGEVSVRFARDGHEALAALRAQEPDIMLLDLHMPKKSGLEVCLQLRGEGLGEDCAIVAVSAGAQEHDLQLLHELGIHHFVQKDGDLSLRLASALREVSGRPSIRPSAP